MSFSSFINIVGIGILAIISIYFLVNLFYIQKGLVEGLANQDDTTSSSKGEAGSAATYASTIKSKTVQLQDELLISKYRKDYENIIINMDDYISMMMLKQLLNINPNADQKTTIASITNLNSLKTTKDTLNSIMKFLDTQ